MSAAPPHRHALIIGVDRAADPHLAPLTSAERDARALAAALEAPACGFAVTLLLGPEATAQRIRREITSLRRQAKQHTLDIIVAFCGHGVPVALDGGGNETFLATHDFTTDDAALDDADFLSLRLLYRLVYKATEPRSAVLILDHCYAGNIRDAGNDRLMIDLRAAIEQYRAEQRPTPVPRDRLRAIISATRPGERAGETDTGGLLTQAILTVLSDKTPVADGHVTINQLDHYLKETFQKQSQQPYTLIEGNYSLTLADYRERIAAERAAAEQQRRRAAAQAMIEHWRSRDSRSRAAELQAGFVGREQELAAIQQHIEQLRPTGGYLLVTGVAGQGKSSILARLANTTDPPIPAYFIRFTPGPDEQAALLGHLIAELLARHGLIEEALTYLADNASPITLRNSLLALLDRLARERPLTLIIDGLDQIPVEGNLGQRDLSFLPERLPAGVVIVIGTRPDDTLVPLKLLTACREYPLPPLSLADFTTLLDRRGVALSEADRVELHRKLHGNAFDLAFLAKELQREPNLADAQALIRRVIANPNNIFTSTIDERLKREPLWESVIEPILGVLTAAQEPLSLPALASILGLKRYRVTDAITLLRGLLGERDREGQARYFLLHLKLLDYLRSKFFPDNELAVFHHRLAHWCERDLDRLWQPANDQTEAERRAYAQTHLVYHLVHAQAYDRLWQLLDADEYGAAKRRADPSLRRYALDLDLARRAVIEAAGSDIAALARSLPRLWQYSLLRCSLTSQIDKWPTELFTALVALGRSAEARDRAELLSDPERRAEVLLAIGHALLERGAPEEAVAVWRGARKAIDAISDARQRTERLCELATAFTKAGCALEADAVFAVARTTAKSITNNWERTILLQNLISAIIRTERYTEAWEIAEATSCDRDRDAVIRELVSAFVKAGRYAEAWTAAKAITSNWDRAIALRSLAAAFAKAERFEEAQIAIDLIKKRSERVVALRELTSSFAQAGRYTEARATAKMISEKDWHYVDALSNIAVALVHAGYKVEADKVFAEARMAAEAIVESHWHRSAALCALATALTHAGYTAEANRAFAEATIAAEAIEKDDWHRSATLRDLAKALAQIGRYTQAQTVIESIPSNSDRTAALRVLVSTLVQAKRYLEAQVVAKTIANEWDRAAVLSDIARALAQTGQYAEVRAVLEAMAEDDWYRTIALHDLADALTQVGRYAEAKATASVIVNKMHRAAAMSAIASALAKASRSEEAEAIFVEAREIAEEITSDRIRAKVLRSLASALAQAGQFEDAKAVIEIIAESDWRRAAAMSTLASALMRAGRAIDATTLFAEARAMIKAIDSDWGRSAALRLLSENLAQAGLYTEARTVADTIIKPSERSIALHTLAVTLTQAGFSEKATEILTEMRVAAQVISEGDQHRATATMLCYLFSALTQAGRKEEASEVLAEVWTKVKLIASDLDKAFVLGVLASVLAQTEQFDEARKTAELIASELDRAFVLGILANALVKAGHQAKAKEVFSEVRKVVAVIANRSLQAAALRDLATALAQAGQFDEALTTAKDIAEPKDRAAALSALITAIITANRIAEAVSLLAEAWQQAQTRNELLGLFAVEAGLIRAYPEIGAGFVQAFAWVEEAMRRGT